MLSGRLRSSGSSWDLRGQRLIGNQKNSVAGKLGDKLSGVGLGLLGIDIELRADAVADNFAQRSASVGSLKDGGCDLVQREERGIGGVHDYHFAGQGAGGNGGTARNVNAVFRHARVPLDDVRSSMQNCELRPTPWHQDRTSGGEWEPGRQNRKRWRTGFPPGPDPRRKKEYCASAGVWPRRRGTYRRGCVDLSPEKTDRQPGRYSSRRPGPTLRRTGCRRRNNHGQSGAGRKFRR